MLNPNVIIHVLNWYQQTLLQGVAILCTSSTLSKYWDLWLIYSSACGSGPFQHFLFSSPPLCEGNTKKGKKSLCLPMSWVSSDIVPMLLITSPQWAANQPQKRQRDSTLFQSVGDAELAPGIICIALQISRMKHSRFNQVYLASQV